MNKIEINFKKIYSIFLLYYIFYLYLSPMNKYFCVFFQLRFTKVKYRIVIRDMLLFCNNITLAIVKYHLFCRKLCVRRIEELILNCLYFDK